MKADGTERRRISFAVFDFGATDHCRSGCQGRNLDSASRDFAFASSICRNIEMYSASVVSNAMAWALPEQADECLKAKQVCQSIANGQVEQKKDVSRIQFIQVLLKEAKSQLTELGYVHEQVVRSLRLTIGICDYPLMELLSSFTKDTDESGEESDTSDIDECESECEQPTGAHEEADLRFSEECKKEALEAIECQLEQLESLKGSARGSSALELEAYKRIRCLPPTKETDRILRYEAHVERQFYRAIEELERLQRRRMGDVVPPPLKVNIG